MQNTAALWYFESVNLFNILCPHKVKAMAGNQEFFPLKEDASGVLRQRSG
jgi:hypothetical protein